MHWHFTRPGVLVSFSHVLRAFLVRLACKPSFAKDGCQWNLDSYAPLLTMSPPTANALIAWPGLCAHDLMCIARCRPCDSSANLVVTVW